MSNSLSFHFPQVKKRTERKPVDRAAESAAIEEYLRTNGATKCPVGYAVGAMMTTAVSQWPESSVVPTIGAPRRGS